MPYMTQQPQQVPANWYPDPQNPAMLRWWDGQQWTGHTQPAQPQASQPSSFDNFFNSAKQQFVSLQNDARAANQAQAQGQNPAQTQAGYPGQQSGYAAQGGYPTQGGYQPQGGYQAQGAYPAQSGYAAGQTGGYAQQQGGYQAQAPVQTGFTTQSTTPEPAATMPNTEFAQDEPAVEKPAPDPNDPAVLLSKLKDLFDAQVLTEEEYEAKKASLEQS